jgi:Na+/H+-dicarboxylate symporter
MQSKRLTQYILFALLLGIAFGYAVHQYGGAPDLASRLAGYLSLLTDIFLRLIKMIIAPLVFSTLVVGIARMGSGATIGRVGVKTFGWFIGMSLISLLLGLVMVNLLKPGVGLHLPLPDIGTASGVSKSAMTLEGFVHHVFPVSVFDAMSRNEILQIVVFALFFGVAAAALGPKAEALINDMDMIAHIMLKVTTYIMLFAPVAVFAAVAAVVAKSGLGVLLTYGTFMLSFYVSILLLWAVILLLGSIFLKGSVLRLARAIREPVLLAFTTASSEAAYPKTLEQLERFGCNNKIASFVLPIGYSFNLDGSMMYCTFATVFIAQAYGIELSLSQEILMLLILMVTSKGMAGVPRASLVVIAATMGQFNIPEAGLLLILGVDHFLDMARSATNVLGNAVATAVVSKWEGALDHGKMHGHPPYAHG